MSLVTVERTFGAVTKDVYVVTGVDATEEIIVADNLAAIDVEFLTIVDAAEGEDLKEKMEVVTLPNGVNAAKFFAPRIFLTAELVALAARRVTVEALGDQIAVVDGKVDALDVRVTALEEV